MQLRVRGSRVRVDGVGVVESRSAEAGTFYFTQVCLGERLYASWG